MLRQTLGIPKSLFNEMLSYLESFKNRFKSLEIEEVLTITMLHIRQADSYNYIHGSVNRVRVGAPIKLTTISKSIRKCLLILCGPNPYLKETQKTYLEKDDENSQTDSDEDFTPNAQNIKKAAEKNARDCYYAGPSFKGLRDGPLIGAFYRSNVGWFANDLSVSLDEGTSWFDRCMHQSRHFLEDQVSRLERRPVQVKSSHEYCFLKTEAIMI